MPSKTGLVVRTPRRAGFWESLAALMRGVPLHRDPDTDPIFAASVIALSAKMARADGQVTTSERAAFARALTAEGRARADAHRLFELAEQTTLGFDAYARTLARRYSAQPGVLEDVLDVLFYIAKADGVVTVEELRFVRLVAEAFGFSDFEFRRIASCHLGPEPNDPYVALGIEPGTALTDVRKAWLRALAANHPDVAMGRGFSGSFVEMANAKAASINAAYQAIVAAHARQANVLDEMPVS
jgi:DnaJ like chaperone protein